MKKLFILLICFFALFSCEQASEDYSPSIKTYTVTFDTDGGSYIATQKVDSCSLVSRPTDPIKSGSTFDGWYTEYEHQNAYDFNTEVTSDFTLYAKWLVDYTSTTFTVTFDTDGGSYITNSYVTGGQVLDRPTDPSKTECVFDWWYTDKECTDAYDFSELVTSNFTLYANWIVNTYTVTFYSNGGSTVSPVTTDYSTIIEAPEVSRTGYTLVGWYTETSFIFEWDFTTTAVTKDITLYAKWINTNSDLDDMGTDEAW